MQSYLSRKGSVWNFLDAHRKQLYHLLQRREKGERMTRSLIARSLRGVFQFLAHRQDGRVYREREERRAEVHPSETKKKKGPQKQVTEKPLQKKGSVRKKPNTGGGKKAVVESAEGGRGRLPRLKAWKKKGRRLPNP